ncbi:MAG: hypothetical protein ACI4O7_06950 [Aristaeellaceae bacterium]
MKTGKRSMNFLLTSIASGTKEAQAIVENGKRKNAACNEAGMKIICTRDTHTED